jgi:xanthine dehydrogenase YagR molybdenum-binding subunit
MIHVAIEVPHGPIVETLLERGFNVYAINPKQAAPEAKDNMGRPEPRIDGRDKITGVARYPSDFAVPNPAYPCLVTSAIARGRISGVDLSAAQAVKGVLDMLTYENSAGAVKKVPFFADGGLASETIVPLAEPKIWRDDRSWR